MHYKDSVVKVDVSQVTTGRKEGNKAGNDKIPGNYDREQTTGDPYDCRRLPSVVMRVFRGTDSLTSCVSQVIRMRREADEARNEKGTGNDDCRRLQWSCGFLGEQCACEH